jgi:hypothetical protein
MPNVIPQNVILPTVIIPKDILPNVIMPNVILPNAIMLIVVAPNKDTLVGNVDLTLALCFQCFFTTAAFPSHGIGQLL